MAQESIRKHGAMDDAVLHKIDGLIALMTRHAALMKAPELMDRIYPPTEIAIRTIKTALYGAAISLAAEIAESI
jgi:hypothetical protein